MPSAGESHGRCMPPAPPIEHALIEQQYYYIESMVNKIRAELKPTVGVDDATS